MAIRKELLDPNPRFFTQWRFHDATALTVLRSAVPAERFSRSGH
jgi:hypothetical protein